MKARGSFVHWLRELVRSLRHGAQRDAELRDEVGSYVDLLTDEKVAAGLPRDAARRAALLELGSVEAVTEQTRHVRAGAVIEQCWQDASFALRLIRRDTAFSVVAVLTLALGIGANTTIFSVINTVLLRPLPYPDPDRLVLLWERNPALGKDRDPVAPLNYQDWRTLSSTFEDLGAYRFGGYALGGVSDPEQLTAATLSASVFNILRSSAEVGRVFTEEEARERHRVVVLTHQFWQRRYGGDTSVIGRSILLNDVAFTVVGVMSPRFTFPDGTPVDLYSPLVFGQAELTGRRSHTLTVIGRLKSATTLEAAAADVGDVARRIAAADSTSNLEVTIARAHDILVEDVRLALMVLLGTAGFVLLIACANVAGLLLVRATGRRREIAMRAALGAGQGRLIRQLLIESVVLALIGGLFGTFLAWGVLGALVGLQLPGLPRINEVGIDVTVLLFTSGAALVTGVLFGVMPALHAVNRRPSQATKSTADVAPPRARSALVVAEVAISLMLMVGAGLMVRTLWKAQSLDLGFQPENVFTAQLLLAGAKYPIDPRQYGPIERLGGHVLETKPSLFFAQLEERLRRVPGVEAAGAVSALPLNPVGTDFDLPVVVEGRPRPRPGEEPQADFRTATPGYFRAMGIPLLRGREFNEFDGPNSPPVVIINEAMARQMFPGEDPLGQQLRLYGRRRDIVGVVGGVRHRGFSGEQRPEMTLPYRQFQFGGMTLAVRSGLDRPAITAALEEAVRTLDAQLPVYRMRPMAEFTADSVAHPRFTAILLGGFAGLALILALIGVYGVTAYTVNQRKREIAIRMALGAERPAVVRLVARQSVAYAAAGVLLGIVGAVAGTRFMEGLLFGVAATDPLTFLSVAAALSLAALAASYVPALRAARVAPASTLRAD